MSDHASLVAIRRQMVRQLPPRFVELRPDGSKVLANYIHNQLQIRAQYDNISGQEAALIDDILDRFVSVLKSRSSQKKSFFELEQVEAAIAALDAGDVHIEESQALNEATHGGSSDKFTKIIDAFDFPLFTFNTVRKMFLRSNEPRSILANAHDKALLFQRRLDVISQRIRRHKLFAPRTSRVSTGEVHFSICSIDSLLGATGNKCVFGMLAELEEGVWYLEDANSTVKLDLTRAEVLGGLICDGCFVLVEGEMSDGVFRVDSIGLPPPEPRETTIGAFPDLQDFGNGGTADSQRQHVAMAQALQQREDDRIVILSEVHLDEPHVLRDLETLFTGFAEAPPNMMVFAGSFFAHKVSLAQAKQTFDALADLIHKHTSFQQTHFVFTPGPRDPSLSAALPYPRLMPTLVARLQQKLRKVSFVSNPARIQYFGQEIVLFRADLLYKIRRHAVLSAAPESATQLTKLLAETVVSQSHLCPFNLDKQPVYWQFDNALGLYPLPDLLILADVVEEYEWVEEGCRVVNPGQFSSTRSFIVYFPASKHAAFSCIPKQ